MPAPALVVPITPKYGNSNITGLETQVGGRPLITQLKALHQKASRALILGQGGTAWAHCREAIQFCNIERLTCDYGEQQARQLCCRLWILYICVLSSMTEVAEEDGKLQPKRSTKNTATDAELTGFPASVREVWDAIMAAFGGYAGNVDSEVLVPTVLLCLKLRDAKTARNIVEAWLATLSDDTMLLLQDCVDNGLINGSEHKQQRTMVQASYMRVCELYTLHILPQLDDFLSAYDFLSMSAAVSAPAKTEFTKRLDSLRNPPPETKQHPKRIRQKTKKSKPAKSAEKIISQQQPPPATAAMPASFTNGNHVVKKYAPRHKESASDAADDIISQQQQQQPFSSLKNNIAVHSSRINGKIAAVYSSSATTSSSRAAVRSRAVAHRPRSIVSVAWQVVRRLLSRWGFTLFTLAIIAAVLRMVAQRFRLPPIFAAVYKKLWKTVKMGTQVTYL
ncbi:hypothetical protein GGI25_003936 [Coemansia spiralis]|uniref:Uncharacterized protein n=2 Tax=Coemansia TaxID=4863 RepID=A0A9W8KX32_9FUNG|nr:hypothetical protein EDC05_004955 [Coemansia umbellata]KAJ2620948.1 hypothetical protein GGI26_004554 [Coemansia sp. RSA 1358]KAJ2675519.1 hypothetical protein GGI25_003936 [Coemansia spiralis]